MKTEYFKTLAILLIFVLSGTLPVLADGETGYTTVSGVIKDQRTKKKLEYVNITVQGTNIGTITNSDGGFTIKITDSIKANTLEISHVGYESKKYPLTGKDVEEATIYLVPYANTLPEVLIRHISPLSLVKEAINKIADNNSDKPNLLTGFYRETVKKRRSYINITEAVVDVYKSGYGDNKIYQDRVKIHKGRQLVSPKLSDTLIVKLQGGPVFAIYLDIVKGRDLMLDEESLSFYKFQMDKPVMIDGRSHFVVNFAPQVILPYALMHGKLYIDEQNLTFTRAEFNLDMDDKNKATRAILKRKPFNLRFKPEEITYLVSYKQHGGRSYLNYIRNEIRFKCDWKRKLFSTNYEVISEMVMTDRKEENISAIPNKLAFKETNSLSDKVSSFYDENFWEDYNIIAPTESLESAVNKLRKKRE